MQPIRSFNKKQVYLNGKPRYVDVLVYGRKGSKSPYAIYYRTRRGRRRLITPFEQKKRGWTAPLSFHLTMMYGELYYNYMKDLVYHTNPFLMLMSKGDSMSSNVFVPIKYK